MAVTDEQRAMLQLLLEGGQGYEDIGSLLGIGPDEVRSRARSALREIGGADPDAQVGLTDYLLGQADPIGRADAVRHLQSDPDANALAQRLVQNLRLLAPKAELPEIPEARGGRRTVPPPPPPVAGEPAAPPPPPGAVAPKGPGLASRAAGFFSGLGRLEGRRRTQVIAGAAGALALVIVLLVVVTSGGGDGGGECKSFQAPAGQAEAHTMKLVATGTAADADCPPSGQVMLGRIPPSQATNSQADTPGVQIDASNVPQLATGESYVVWLYRSDNKSVPLGPATVGGDGNLNSTIPVPLQELAIFPAFQTMRVSRVTTAQGQQIQQSITQQGKKPTLLIPFVGESVLQGEISELGLNQLLQQLQTQLQAQQRASGGKKG